MVFNNEINVFDCPHCKTTEKLKFPLLCSKVDRGIAVWYEPHHDEQIDKDIEAYKKHMGPIASML